MHANGPAIKGGCVTRRKHWAESWYFSRGVVPVARQVWRAFCHHGTIFIACRRGRGISFISGRVFLPVNEFGKRNWRSVAVQIVSEAENCQGTEFILRAVVRVRVRVLNYILILVSGS